MPKIISVICGNLYGLPQPALEFLILKLNSFQSDVEYQFIPLSLFISKNNSEENFVGRNFSKVLNSNHVSLYDFKKTTEEFIKPWKIDVDEGQQFMG